MRQFDVGNHDGLRHDRRATSDEGCGGLLEEIEIGSSEPATFAIIDLPRTLEIHNGAADVDLSRQRL